MESKSIGCFGEKKTRLLLFSCPGSSIPDRGQSLTHSVPLLNFDTKSDFWDLRPKKNNDNEDIKANNNEDNDNEDNDSEDNNNKDNDINNNNEDNDNEENDNKDNEN